MRARQLARRAPALLLLLAAVVPPCRGAPDGRPQVAVLAGEESAGVVVWPASAAGDSRPEVPRVAGWLAARAAARAVAAGAAARPRVIAFGTPSGPAAGFVVPRREEDRLLHLLSALATAAPPPDADLRRELEAARRAASARDPLRLARDAAVALAAPGAARPPLPGELAALEPAALRRFLARRAGGPVEIRLAGSAALAERAAARLAALPLRDLEPRPARPGRPGRLLLDRPDRRDTAGLALAFPISAETARRLGPSWPLLAEVLAEGPGSIEQRLAVASGDRAEAVVALQEAPEGGALLVIAARVPAGDAAEAWRTVEGALTSLRRLPPGAPALLRARRRLDARAAARSIERTLARRGAPSAWSWPPAERWAAPPGASEVQAAARALPPSGSASAVLLLPRGAPAPAGMRSAPRRPLEDLCPGRPDDRCEAPAAPAETGPAGRLAVDILRRLADRPVPGAFEARYLLEEQTPTGTARATLTLRADAAHLQLRIEGPGWTVEAHEPGNGARIAREGHPPASAYLGAEDRLEAIAYRQPAVLAAAVAGGLLAADRSAAPCGTHTCDTLTADLPAGGRLALVVEPGSARVLELRVYLRGRAGQAAPDETVRFGDWRTVEGVVLAGELTIERQSQPPERWHLIDWRWSPEATR